jgi:predicted transcriptional regulator
MPAQLDERPPHAEGAHEDDAARQRMSAAFEAIAVVGKAFTSPRRLELLDLLLQGPRSVNELARASEQSVANASQHLQVLHASGVVVRRRQGTRVRYALAGDEMVSLWHRIRNASAVRLAEAEPAARNDPRDGDTGNPGGDPTAA